MSNPLYDAIFRVAEVLEIPVVAAALASLAVVIVELGRYVVEVSTRRRLRPGPLRTRQLERAARTVRSGTSIDDALLPYAWSAAIERALVGFGENLTDEAAINKGLADFDLACERRLARTRLLVRVGPALGLMGTLIPLTPALDGLANGNVRALTDNLRVAFSVTVLGLLVGAVAFALSLARENMYGQDFSDLEFVAATLTSEPVEPEALP